MSLMQSAPLCVARGRYMRRVPRGRKGKDALPRRPLSSTAVSSGFQSDLDWESSLWE